MPNGKMERFSIKLLKKEDILLYGKLTIWIWLECLSNTNPPIDDVYQVGDVFLTAEVVGEFYPYIKQWFVSETCGGTDTPISWEDAEFIDLERVDQYLNKTIKEWVKRWEDARRNR